MSSRKMNADDSLKAEMLALVQEKLRTGAYLAQIEKLHDSSVGLIEKWKEQSKSMKKYERMLVVIRRKRKQFKSEMNRDAIASDSSDNDDCTLERNKHRYSISAFSKGSSSDSSSGDSSSVDYDEDNQKLLIVQKRFSKLKCGSAPAPDHAHMAALTEEFSANCEHFKAYCSKLKSLKSTHKILKTEAEVLGLAIRVHRIKAKVEFLEQALKDKLECPSNKE